MIFPFIPANLLPQKANKEKKMFPTPQTDGSNTVQGWAKVRFPGSVKMRGKSCVLLPAAGRTTRKFLYSYSRNLGFVDLPIPVQWFQEVIKD